MINLKMSLNYEIIANEKAINFIARNYNTLDYSINLVKLLMNIFPKDKVETLSKYDLHKLINDLLLTKYNGEEILKYKLCQCFIDQQDIVAAFEIKVNNSRLDFLTINGHTTSFEIKSELDNLTKLRKQMTDYVLAFEYNYLVIDEKHINKTIELIPDCFGLWTYKNGKYKKVKKAELSPGIDAKVQLSLLTKKELNKTFPEYGGIIRNILTECSSNYINQQFKIVIKDRYKSRWDFLTANRERIFPIDLQFFFSTNISPSCIYGL